MDGVAMLERNSNVIYTEHHCPGAHLGSLFAIVRHFVLGYALDWFLDLRGLEGDCCLDLGRGPDLVRVSSRTLPELKHVAIGQVAVCQVKTKPFALDGNAVVVSVPPRLADVALRAVLERDAIAVATSSPGVREALTQS